MKAVFPTLIHVCHETADEAGYLVVYKDGVFGIDEPGKPVAIYKLVDVGMVKIDKFFVSKRNGTVKPKRQQRRPR